RGRPAYHLLAFVLTPQEVRRVELGPVMPISEAVDGFLARLKLRPTAGDDDPAQVLRQKVWQPLQPALGGAKLVLLAPDGPLCRLPFAALPSADGKTYLIEQTALVVVPVPQMLPELLAPRGGKADDRPPALLALGDIDFDADPGA